MSDTFDAELARYEARIAAAREVIRDPGAITVSRFDLWEDGLWYYPNWGAIDQVIDDLGFARPPVQAEATESMNGISVERIQEFDGDVLIASRATRFGQTIPMLEEQWDSVAPFWRQLEGVRSNNLFWYERDILVGYTFESLDRSIDFLTAITAGRDVN
jgi:iron complex transport system substrate-binding protein